MSTQNTGSVFQKENGYWGYRFVVTINGKKIDRKCSFDEHGNKFRTKREAAIAREEAIRNLRIEKTEKPQMVRKTVKEVFEEFRAEGRKDRAYKTKLKQDNFPENEIREIANALDCEYETFFVMRDTGEKL